MERRRKMIFRNLEAELGVTSYIISEEVRSKLLELRSKVEADLYKGFTSCEGDNASYSVVYSQGLNGSKFMVVRTFDDGCLTRETIRGEQESSLGKINALIGRPFRDSILDCQIYLDGNLIAGGKSKRNPFGISLLMLGMYEKSNVDFVKTKYIFERMKITGFPIWNYRNS